MSIEELERATYEQIWSFPVYSEYAPGEEYAEAFMEMTGAARGEYVLDAGCGTGRGAVALTERGLRVHLADLTGVARVPKARGLPFVRACLWKPFPLRGYYDWAYCCDVMEHIPAPLTMLVAARLLETVKRGVFFSIALHPDDYGAWIGRPLHQTVQAFTEWRDQLSEVGTVKECRDLINTGLYLVTP